ncbi:hypothetical protein ETD86_34885 [Nonomuraea turkmeniaca]|uniref:C1q domain-containing protein n=1 Tax=Nonomuraea turkmeniaca TaxID=103838 RepID=A0A5S4F6V2_9ACTN|nr:hypothetical protein ETD86_34885 [Nonomuraea turkmeniaca]
MGELLTATKMNADVRDGLNFLLSPPYALLTRSSVLSIPNNAVNAIAWNAETIDRDGGHSTVTNPSRYTCATAGYYEVWGYIKWATVAGGYRACEMRKNGGGPANVDYRPLPSSNEAANQVRGDFFLNVGDYMELWAFQNSGGSINIDNGFGTTFGIRWIST